MSGSSSSRSRSMTSATSWADGAEKSCGWEDDSRAGDLRLNEAASANIPLATRVMAGPADKLKW